MMEQSLHGEVMKTQDLPDVVVTVSKNPHGYKLAWDFLQAHWNTLIKKSVSPSLMIVLYLCAVFLIRERENHACAVLSNGL